MNKWKITIVLLFTLFFKNVVGQDCYQQVENIKRAYYNGNFDELNSFDKDCLKGNHLSKNEKSEVLRLLIDAAIIENNQKAATENMQLLLEVNPELTIRSTDRAAFIELYNSFKIDQKIKFNFQIGSNQSDYPILFYRSISSITSEPGNYQPDKGFSSGIMVDYYLKDFASVFAGVLFTSTSYVEREEILDYQFVEINETYHLLNIPLGVKISKQIKGYESFIGGGVSFQYLQKSFADLSHFPLTNEFVSGIPGIPEFAQNYNTSSIRKKYTKSWLILGGVSRKIGNSLEVNMVYQFEYGLNNLVNVNNRYKDEVLINDYAYVSDDFKRNMSTFFIGISKVIYRIKE